VMMNGLLGAAGAVLLGLAAPFLVRDVFRITGDLARETEPAIIVIALSLPIVLASSAARGVLEGAQRFDVVSLVSAPSSSATYLLPAIGATMQQPLPILVALLVVGRVAALLAYVFMWTRAVPSLQLSARTDLKIARSLVGYGGWLTLSGVASPLLVYGERAVITSTLGVGILSLYAIPYDLVARIWVVPASLAAALYPAFAVARGGPDTAVAYQRSLLYLLFLLSPAVVFLVGAGKDILQVWLGHEIARESVMPLQVFTAGAVLTSLAYVPLALLQATGRASAAGKLHVGEIVPAVALTWLLSTSLGLAGSVYAWLLRTAFDALVLLALAYVMVPDVTRTELGRTLRAAGLVGLGICGSALVSSGISDFAARIALLILLSIALSLGFWKLLTAAERSQLVLWASSILRR
jgi:O-antigen/teichoic acid export membrane protein